MRQGTAPLTLANLASSRSKTCCPRLARGRAMRARSITALSPFGSASACGRAARQRQRRAGARSPPAAPALATRRPRRRTRRRRRWGLLVQTTVKQVGTGSRTRRARGSAISYADGVQPGLLRPGPRHRRVCRPATRSSSACVSLPQNCPPGDERGKVYRATNLGPARPGASRIQSTAAAAPSPAWTSRRRSRLVRRARRNRSRRHRRCRFPPSRTCARPRAGCAARMALTTSTISMKGAMIPCQKPQEQLGDPAARGGMMRFRRARHARGQQQDQRQGARDLQAHAHVCLSS